MTTGQILRKFRILKNISQLELELAINASTGTISRIENGRINPTKETLFKIAEFLGLNSFESMQLLGLNYNFPEQYIPNKILKQKFFDLESLGKQFENVNSDFAYYKGKEYFINECDESLNTDTQEVLYIHSIINWRKVYREDYANTYHVPIRMQKKKYARFILNCNSSAWEFKSEDAKYFRATKISTNMDFDYNLMILNDRFTLFLSDPIPITLTINDPSLAKKLRATFNNTWSQLQN